MLVYHGSIASITEPRVDVGRKNLDFGPGFYATTLPEQADAWAKRKAYENDMKSGVVSVYKYTESEKLNTLSFIGYSTEWLMFVVDHRSNDYKRKTPAYDLIVGSIADDRVIDTINYYIDELANDRASEELLNLTLKQLSYQEPNDQICFATKEALMCLEFVESYEVVR